MLALEEFIPFICIADEQHMTWRFYFSPVLAMSQCCQVWSLGSPSNPVVLPVPQGLLTPGNRLSTAAGHQCRLGLVTGPSSEDTLGITAWSSQSSCSKLISCPCSIANKEFLGLSKPLTDCLKPKIFLGPKNIDINHKNSPL